MASPVGGLIVLAPDRLSRSVWVVVDPRDFVTGLRIPAQVRLADVAARPLVGASGVHCFVDLNLPAGTYAAQVQPLPVDRTRYFDAEQEFLLDPVPVAGQPLRRNLVPVDLLPRPGYPFAEQATLARGRLRQASDNRGIAGANVFLIVEGVDQGRRGRTDERGEFVVVFPGTGPEDAAAAGLKDFDFQLRFEIEGQPPLLIAEETVREGATFSLQDIPFPGT